MGAAATDPDPGTVLVGWLQERWGRDVRLAAPTETNDDGFDSAIHFLSLTGDDVPADWRRPLVLRIKPGADQLTEAQREADIQTWAADAGLSVPRVLLVVEPGEPFDRPGQVMERALGGTMLEAFSSAPWRARTLLRRLGGLHAELHSTPITGFPDGDDLLDRRLALVRSTAEQLEHTDLRRALDDVERLAPRLRGWSPAVCHGDFHPLNVLVGDDELHLIDWTDAGVGDPNGDVARTLLLFSVAWITADNAVERTALKALGPVLSRIYRSAYAAERPIDDERVALWTPVHLLHGWSQTVGVREGLFGDEGAIPSTLTDLLKSRLDRALDEVR